MTREAWNFEFDESVASGWRPRDLTIAPSMFLLKVAGNSTIGPWVLRSNMTSAQYQAEFDRLFAQGMAPLRVAAQGTGAAARFAAIFATRE